MARKAKARIKVADERMTGAEPTFDNCQSPVFLIQAYNWYNYYFRDDKKHPKLWLIDYMKSNGFTSKQIAKLNKVDKIPYSAAVNSRILMRGYTGDRHADVKKIVDSFIEKVMSIKPQRKRAAPVKSKVIEINNHIIANGDEILDNFYRSGYKEYDFSKLLENSKVSEFKTAIRYFTELLDELEAIPYDKDLQEGYSHLKKRHLNKYMQMLNEMIELLKQNSVTRRRRTVRKPRSKKAKTAEQIFAKFNYLQHNELASSVEPSKILGNTLLWVYNVDKRKLTYLVAEEGKGFEVKGTTILNVDLDKSYSKKIRKPEETVPKVLTLAKMKLEKEIEELKTVKSSASPRMNNSTLLLRTFK